MRGVLGAGGRPRLRRLRATAIVVAVSLTGCSEGPETLAETAAEYRADLREGQVLGQIEFPRTGKVVPVREGLDQEIIDIGPGWFSGSRLPGEGSLIYVAGHRTTHGAPFRSVGRLARGDLVIFKVPYAVATYEVTGRTLWPETDTDILQPGQEFEQLRLQTSTIPESRQRVIVFARLARIEARPSP